METHRHRHWDRKIKSEKRVECKRRVECCSKGVNVYTELTLIHSFSEGLLLPTNIPDMVDRTHVLHLVFTLSHSFFCT